MFMYSGASSAGDLRSGEELASLGEHPREGDAGYAQEYRADGQEPSGVADEGVASVAEATGGRARKQHGGSPS